MGALKMLLGGGVLLGPSRGTAEGGMVVAQRSVSSGVLSVWGRDQKCLGEELIGSVIQGRSICSLQESTFWGRSAGSEAIA